METESSEKSNWLLDYGIMDSHIPLPASLNWSFAQEAFADSSAASADADCSVGDLHIPQEIDSHKRLRCETFGSKACREKLRRDRLNERFLELSCVLDPGSPVKTDKYAILSDASRMVTQLRNETHRLKESNKDLQVKIKELKVEKNELREEKQRLKLEKERLEKQFNAISAQPGILCHTPAIPVQAAGNKLIPYVGYPGVAMWQFMPPAAIDTTKDHILHPPVA